MSEITHQLGLEGGLFLSQLVNFGIMLVVLSSLLYNPVLNMLNERKERIAQSMKDAERVSQAAAEAEKEKADILDEARREAQEIRAAATRDAEKIANEVRGRAEQEATEIRIKAQEDAQTQVEAAMSDANKQIADLAILATEQLLGKELAQKDEQRRFVTEFLEQNGSA